METKEVQKKARSFAVAGTQLRDLFPPGNSLFASLAHVGDDSVSHVVLLWVWLHGFNEPVANCQWEADRGILETDKSQIESPDVRYALACRDVTNPAPDFLKISKTVRAWLIESRQAKAYRT